MLRDVFRSRERWKPIDWYTADNGRSWVTFEAVNDGVYLGAGEFYSSMRTGSRCIVRVEIYHHEPSDSDHVSYQVATLEFPENSEHREAAGPWLHCYDGLGYKGLTCDKWPMLVIN